MDVFLRTFKSTMEFCVESPFALQVSEAMCLGFQDMVFTSLVSGRAQPRPLRLSRAGVWGGTNRGFRGAARVACAHSASFARVATYQGTSANSWKTELNDKLVLVQAFLKFSCSFVHSTRFPGTC